MASRAQMLVVILLTSTATTIVGQNCLLDSACSALGYPKRMSIGNSGTSANFYTYISCPWRGSTNPVTSIEWLFAQNSGSAPQVLDVDSNPKLILDRFTLILSNVTGEYEGIYSCRVQYSDGSESSVRGAACVFVAGRSHFTSCPGEQTSEGCSGTTHLEGEEHGSVEFDARLDYSYGGSCEVQQTVRHIFLNRIDRNGNSESLYVCSNLGSFGSRNCENRTHVTISYQGEDKFDLRLSLNSLNLSSSGRYQLRVSLNEMGGRRSNIYKEFSIIVRDTASPNSTTETEDSITRPLLMLDGEVLESGSNLTFERIKVKGQALLCVVPHRRCCNTGGLVSADFLFPDGTSMSGDGGCSRRGVYVTKGRQIVRLNFAPGIVGVLPPTGLYCCSVSTEDGVLHRGCVTIQS